MSDETPNIVSESAGPRVMGAVVPSAEVKAWFVREILPLEAMLMRFLHKNWRNASDVEDLRQEVYAHVLNTAETNIPERPKPFLFATARNVLVDRLRKESIVPIELAADLDLIAVQDDTPGPERTAYARDTLRKLQLALDHLPPRAKEALLLKRVEGLSRKEIAERMGIAEQSVGNHVQRAMLVLADLLYGERTVLGGEHDLS